CRARCPCHPPVMDPVRRGDLRPCARGGAARNSAFFRPDVRLVQTRRFRSYADHHDPGGGGGPGGARGRLRRRWIDAVDWGFGPFSWSSVLLAIAVGYILSTISRLFEGPNIG